MTFGDVTLPRRAGRRPDLPPPQKYPPSLAGNRSLPYPALGTELADLRVQIPGVRGSILGAADGLLIVSDVPPDLDADELAALAATTYGLGRQVGARLGQGSFQQSTVRNETGYLSVYAVGRHALLAVVGQDAINVARLHLHAPPVAARLAGLLGQV